MRSGFTLVELSIVLVIIGLLIGGVLAGQSMVDTARVTRIVKDLSTYEIAISQFYNNFKTIPGDSNQFTPAGNGNRVFDSGACIGANSGDESTQVWGHLSLAGMLKDSFGAYRPTGCAGGTHNATYEDISNAGIVWPFMVVDGPAAAYLNKKKAPVTLRTSYNSIVGVEVNGLIMSVFFNTQDLKALEVKLGAAPPEAGSTEGRWVNFYGQGMCYDLMADSAPCADVETGAGHLHYHFRLD